MIEKGTLVATVYGKGVVQYVRLAPPNYCDICAVSVKLDGRDHAGTILGPAEVWPIPDGEAVEPCQLGTGRPWFRSEKAGKPDPVYLTSRTPIGKRRRIYRIARESHGPGWRLDCLDLCIWVALTPTVYARPQDAAADLENVGDEA